MVSVGQECRDNGGDARGMQERLQGTGTLGVDLVQAVHGLVHLDAQFDLPPHTVEVGYLPGANPGREVRQEETVARRRVDADEAEMPRVLRAPHPDVSINGPAIKGEDMVLAESVEVGPGEEFLGDVATGKMADLGFQ
jgi:hypothetical protein